MILPLFVQTSPHYYSDPEKFNPDNFLPNACSNRHPYAFLPFGAGYKNCIGIKYAMFQIKTVVSTLVRRNIFAPSNRCPTPEHLRLMFLMTLKFVDGCYVKMLPRTSTPHITQTWMKILTSLPFLKELLNMYINYVIDFQLGYCSKIIFYFIWRVGRSFVLNQHITL